MRYFISLSYHGAHYSGWQLQPNALTVQEVLEDKISRMLRHPVRTYGAGRTDTGVHALEMVAHFDTDIVLRDDFINHLNNFLPKDIVAHQLIKVKEEAHARYSAIKRAYIYKISTQKDPFRNDSHWYIKHIIPNQTELDKAILALQNTKDFASFMKTNTSADNSLCQIYKVDWVQTAADEITFEIEANRFLRNMVRAIVGTLVLVAKGQITSDDFQQIIDEKDRRFAGQSAPAHGLYISKVSYPQSVFL